MRKITLVLVTLAFAAGMAMAEDVIISVSGSASVEWGFSGQLIDNSGSFLDAGVPSGDFTSDGGDLDWERGPKLGLTGKVEDADGNVIVEAASKTQRIDLTTYPVDSEFDRLDISTPEEIVDLKLDYINFPNVIPGVLGIKLMGNDDLDPGNNVPKDSTSKNERILVNLTPMGDALDVTLGLLIKPDNKLYTNYYDDLVTPGLATQGNFFFDVAGTDTSVLDNLDENGWEAGTYLSWAASLEATYTLALGDEDEVSIGFGTIIDSAFTNGVYEPDTLVTGTTEDYEVFNGDVLNGAGTEAVVTEMYGAITVDALSIKDMMPTLFDVTSTAEGKELRTNEVLGRATIPFGAAVSASIGDLTADVDFQMVLAEGNAMDALTGGLDLTDETKNTINFAPYAMPMYAMVDLGYELAMGDMTITPGVNFKYSSDYWKWVWDGDVDDWEWRYDGDVSGADYVGRPMSLDVGVDVEGIAGMIDVSISAGLALGDGDANHGYGILNGATPAALSGYELLLGGLPAYTYAWDAAGVIQTATTDNTLAELIDFWYIEPTRANPYGSTVDTTADSASDGLNNMYFASGASAMDIEVGITIAPLDGLTIENTTTYMVDNLGISGADDSVLFGTALSTLSNETVVEYDWMVGDAVAFTIFGELVYETNSYDVEKGQKYIGLRAASETVSPEVFEFNYSEAPSQATFDYKVGVKVAVGL